MRNFVVVDAPSNLGLRPPAPGTVPGCHKLAGALREQGILRRLGAAEGGVVVPPRYDRGDWREGDGVFNAAALSFTLLSTAWTLWRNAAIAWSADLRRCSCWSSEARSFSASLALSACAACASLLAASDSPSASTMRCVR